MKYPFFTERFLKGTLVVLTAFCALASFNGGYGLMFKNGFGMPAAWLDGIFPSYFIPGLMLFVIIGGTNLLAAIMITRNSRYAMESAMVAGFGMQIWIFTEMYIIRQQMWLLGLYFGLGTVILVFAFLLYGRYNRKGS